MMIYVYCSRFWEGCQQERGRAGMNIWTLLAVASGLAMDAFAVSISCGMSAVRPRRWERWRAAALFGLFQGVMPIIGFLAAHRFAAKIAVFDHWMAFGLLACIGGNMLWEAREDRDTCCTALQSPKELLLLAVATSIDALAVGASLAVMPHTGVLLYSQGYLVCAAVIAGITFLLCQLGLLLGGRTGDRFGRRAEILGGLLLIGMGLKILLEHTLL